MLSKFIAIIISLFILSGCSIFQPKEIVVTKTKIVVVDVPAYMFVEPEVEQPPNPQTYIKMNYEQKEDTLVNYGISLLSSIENFSKRLNAIKQYIEEEKLKLQKE